MRLFRIIFSTTLTTIVLTFNLTSLLRDVQINNSPKFCKKQCYFNVIHTRITPWC